MAKIFQPAKSVATKANKLIGQTIKVTIERLDINGVGVGRYQKQSVFIANTLVGEQVQAKVVEANSKFIKAKAIKVTSLANDRVKPSCQHYYLCGGCDLQHLSHQGQLAFKQQKVTELFARQGIDNLPWQQVVSDEPWHYRRKARIGVQYNKLGEATLGFRQKESNTLTPIKHCQVLAEPLANVFTELSQLVNALAAPGSIGHFEVIQTEQTTILVRQLRPLAEQGRAIWQQAEQRNGWRVLFDDGNSIAPLMANSAEPADSTELAYQLDNTYFVFSTGRFYSG